MTLDTSRLPALVWMKVIACKTSTRDETEIMEITKVEEDGFCINNNGAYATTTAMIEKFAWRIIYYDTLKELLPEEFI